MSLLGPIIGGIASIWSGRRAEKREEAAIAAQNAYNDPSAIRARAEKAGFNPLLFVGPGVGLQTAVGGSNYMGSAIADFAQTIGGLLEQRELMKADRLNQAIQRKANAQQKLTRMLLRPTVAGPLELARARGGDATALGLRGNTGSSVPVLPATGKSLPFYVGGAMDAIASAAPSPTDLAATPAASDFSKAVPKAPYFWDGQWYRPHPDFPDATFVEDYLGDEGPAAWIGNAISGMKKLGYHFAQSKTGMIAKGWLNGSYLSATRRAATDRYVMRMYGTDFSDYELGPDGYLVPRGK